MARLTYGHGDERREFALSEVFTIGRDPENDLPLPDDTSASRRHARVKRIAGAYVVEDLDSRNGTFVERGGDVLRVSGPLPLEPSDVIRVGQARVAFAMEAAAGAPSTATQVLDPALTDVPGVTRVGRPVPVGAPPEPPRATGGRGANLWLLIGASGVVAVLAAVVAIVLARL